MRDQPNRVGAGRMILLAVAAAMLLLWMDGWSHSVPVMIATAVVALMVFLAFRNAPLQRDLTDYERIELERESAHRWMARNGARPEDEARDNRPKLELIRGGKTDLPEDELVE